VTDLSQEAIMDLAKAAAWPPGNWISLRLNVEWASVHAHRANRRNARTRSNKLTGASVIANETIAEQVGWDREILTIGLTVLIDLLPVEGFESFERMGAARSSYSSAPHRRHSGSTRSPAGSALGTGETAKASGGARKARGAQTMVASDCGDVQ
jgi:hypothetical protein